MTPRLHRIVLVLFALQLAGVCYAIYDPSLATTKPPKRREPVLPWYLKNNGDPVSSEESDFSRSPKWQIEPEESPRKPVIVHSDRKTWSPWRKAPDSEIEQRSEIVNGPTKPIDSDSKKDSRLEFGEIEQKENEKFLRPPGDPKETQHKEDCIKTEDPKDSGAEDKNDFYEGLSDDNTKPRKEKILLSSKPKSTVARYDAERGIQCPDFDSTGQFVYPLDCKFFVNCWNGRAFVQPCAPGTLFNPDTLECDFPHKVKCQGEGILGFPLKYVDGRPGQPSLTHSGREQLEVSPKCPPHISGMLPHPTDCTKFLQCAHGGTFIMDCGPGTVFNPAISVCDWPRNVKGCEGAFKTEEDVALTPPHSFDHPKSEYNENPKPKIECPPDYTGLLPHPETCKKFLQCANGITYIMDCGPGTAFNPETSVCDWPYNVPGCNNDKPVTNTPTTVKPSWPHFTTTSTPEVDWNSRLRPTWIPTWKPNAWATPGPYPSSQHGHPDYNRGQGHGPGGYTTNNYPHHHALVSTSNHQYDGQFNVDQTTPGANWPGHGHHPGHHGEQGHRSGHWRGHGYGRGHGHSNSHQPPPASWDYPTYTNPVETYTQRPQTSYDQTQKQDHPDGGFVASPQNPWLRNRTEFQENNRRIDQGHTYNRQGYGRIAPGFFPPVPGQVPAPDGSVPTSGNSGIPVTGGTFWKNRTIIVWPSGNKTVWSQTEVPTETSSWNQQAPLPPIVQQPPPNRKWNQESGLSLEDKLLGWDSQSNIYQQNTANKEAEAKFNQWAGRTNVFLNAKGHTQPGTKNNPPQSFYPDGVHVNINGTRGHFITKEIEINQGHSMIKNYGQNDTAKETEGSWSQNESQSNKFKPADKPPYVIYYPPILNLTEYFHNGQQTSEYTTNPPSTDDLLSSGSGNRRAIVPPPTILQPPHRQFNNHTTRGWNSTRYYPRPKEVLQPPYFEDPHAPISTPAPRVATTYPPRPAIGLLPPLPDNPSRRIDERYPSKPSVYLEPPYYEDPGCPFNSPNCNSRGSNKHPKVPSTNLEPPPFDGPSDWETATNAPRFNQPSRPAIELEPPDFDPPDQTTAPKNFPGKVKVPATHLQPPIPEVYRTTASPTTTTTRRIPEKPLVSTRGTVLEDPKRRSFNVTPTMNPKVPIVSIDHEDKKKNKDTRELVDVVEPELDYDVDVLDDKGSWKPVLVFENKTKTTTTESSVVMKINKKKVDVELFNVEVAPFADEEPPFPTYYVPPVQPLTHSKKTALPTPISGQVIRLRGGSGPHDGYVEVQGINPGWGIVCDTRNSWTLKEAHVVCRQLGYSRGAEMAWQGRNNKNGLPDWIAANSVACNGTETKFQSCKFTHTQECRVERDAIGVRCVPNPVAHCGKDEVPHEGQCYHLADPDSSLNHAEALQYCAHRNARLLDIVSQQENNFISEWLLQLHPEIGSIMTSGVGFTTLNRTMWLWEDSSRAKFRFAKWWPGWMEDKRVPPWVGARPVCIVMKRKFPCHDRPDSICLTDYFFWDTEDCATSMKGHSYVCERPYSDIGCVYGKGNLYVGNANVTVSGKDCLPWADERVAHPLLVNVVNRDVREKLKMHNFCRNPNPNKESRPWCFTGPSGQREHCDIPPCGNIGSKKSLLTGQCKPRHFECLPGECIPSPWVCDGEPDCTNGADERACMTHLRLFKKSARNKLEGHDVEKWLNTPLRTCALRCKEADFTCRSFSHKSAGNICLLSDSNIGMTGALKPNKEFDYYEMKERSLDCEDMYVCRNRKCINQTKVCNGKNDCNDRSDEDICTVENLDYAIRLAGSNNSHEGRVEVKILGVWGQVCDDGFGMIDADVICKELGFTLGALEVRPGGFYGNLDPPTRFMVDQLKCRGNETSLRECDFDGWGVHNCQPEEAVGVVCKTAMDTCQDGHWKCDGSPLCIPTPFICDEVVDCPDGSDESTKHCDAPFEIRLANGSSPLQGRVEVRHHGIWGTVCDDDFSNATATVICRSLGYGGVAIAKKDSYFGPGQGPIWLDEVFCYGNETQLYRCEHNHWGQHNCDHNEDAGVICTPGDVNAELSWNFAPKVPEMDVNDLLPADCGKRSKDFNDDEDLIFAKVVHGSIAPKGTYPWQASIRVRGHSRSNHWCGAVILSPLHVLTAAHCLEGYIKGTYFVRAGDYNTEIDEGTEVEANIEDYYIHEDFRKGHRMNNDIALVLLKGRGIPLGKHIMPICLPSENTEYRPGLNCTISGFGSIETGKSAHSKDLRYGWIPLLDQSVCRADYIYGAGAISDGMVCAGHLDEGVDTCDGDSGGPLACYHNGAFTLYGITSWGQHCGKANKPGVYVRVSYYRRWIDQKLKESLVGR